MIDGYYPKDSNDYLRIALGERRRRNSSYSIRAFARDLKVSVSHLSEVLSGKTTLSPKMVLFFSQKLGLNEQHQEHWLDLLGLKSKKNDVRKLSSIRVLSRIKESRSTIQLDTFQMISEWYHFAILTFFELAPDYKVAELSSQLGVSAAKVREALKRLVRLGLLVPVEGGYRPVTEVSFTGDTQPSAAIRESHRQVLKMTIRALDEMDMSERSNQSLFIAVRKDRAMEFRKTLKKRVMETVLEFTDEKMNKNEYAVHVLNWNFYPLQEKKEQES